MKNLLSLLCSIGVMLLLMLGCGGTSSSNTAINANSSPEKNSASSSDKSSQDLFFEGSAAYKKNDYKSAIESYKKALDLEKKDRKLEKKVWLILVDNLGMAYGLTGDLENSKAVLEYGISQEPTYPMFYYNIACGYGEKDDEDGAIQTLQLAFKYKDNMIDGEKLPNPLTDSSFKKFKDDARFKAAVAEMQSGK